MSRLLEKFRNAKLFRSSFRLSWVCLLIYAFVQCFALGISNLFLVLSLLFSLIFIINHRNLVKRRIKKYKNIFIFYLIFLVCLLPSVIFSPEPLFSWEKIVRIFFFRSTPFLIVLLICPSSKYALTLVYLTFLSFVITSLGALVKMGGEETWRVSGIYGHPMTLAGFLCLLGPLSFCLVFTKPLSIKKLILHFSCFVFVVFIALLNGTRGAWIALFVSLLITGLLFAFQAKRNLLVLAILTAGILVTVGSSQRLTDRLSTIPSTTYASNTERIVMWGIALRMWGDNPLTGVGYNRYKKVYREQYTSKNAHEHIYTHPHNNLLYVLSDSGSLGFLGYCLFFGYVFLFSLRRLIKKENIYYLLIFTTTLSLQLQGLTEYNFGNQPVIKLYWLLLGCYLLLAENECKKYPL